MYKELFDRNQEALSFIQKKTDINSVTLNSILPISATSLQSKTIVGIADIMTEFAKKKVEDAKDEIRVWLKSEDFEGLAERL